MREGRNGLGEMIVDRTQTESAEKVVDLNDRVLSPYHLRGNEIVKG